MRKIITFLGKYPKETRYQFAGKTYTGSVFAEALRQFVEYDEMLVLLTDEARAQTWPTLAALGDSRIQDVSIRRGENSDDLWGLFDAILPHIDVGDTVIFDITHGLRSLPFLVFLFAAYLKAVRKVRIEAIYYGALELGDAAKGVAAPVLDLSEFVAMLDWLTAADRFTRFGDAQDLAALLRRAGGGASADPLTLAAEGLDKLSQSLRLIRPADAMEISATLPGLLERARPQAETTLSARPYALLAEDLEDAYKPFALAGAFDPEHLAESLGKQRDLIAWYVERAQWAQAVSLAREWLVSWVMWHLGESNLLDRDIRESIAQTMSHEAQRRRAAKEENREFRPLLLRQVPHITNVLGTWLSLADVRNDIDHAGMKRKPKSAEELIKAVTTLCRKLAQLPLERPALPSAAP